MSLIKGCSLEEKNRLVLDYLPWAQGETVSLVKAEWEDFCIFVPPDDAGYGKNVVFFVAKDKKGYEQLVNKLRHIVICIEQHNDRCDCS